jgi:type IV pilus assembly protein PilA
MAGIESVPANINGKYVSSVTVGAGGLVAVAYANAGSTHTILQTGILNLSPFTNAGSIEWVCKAQGTTISDKHLPAACR